MTSILRAIEGLQLMQELNKARGYGHNVPIARAIADLEEARRKAYREWWLVAAETKVYTTDGNSSGEPVHITFTSEDVEYMRDMLFSKNEITASIDE